MSSTTVLRPTATEYGAGFGDYIRLVPEFEIPSFLEAQLAELLRLLQGVSEPESLVHHAPYTWSSKQVVGHVTDCERVFGYRALRIARNDVTPLAAFDEQAYLRFVDFDRCPLAEFWHVRRSHVILLRHLEPEAWLRRGVANNEPMSVRALA